MSKKVIDVIEGRYRPKSDEVDVLVRCARKNKVLLHFLRAAGIRSGVANEEERRFEATINTVRKISEVLKGTEYVFFKFVKPIFYVPADIDILVEESYVGRAVRALVGLGFRVVVLEPYTITLTKEVAIVDIYTHPSIGGSLIYIDGRELFEHTRTIDFYGVEIPTLERYAEVVVSAAHAVYKEKLYTLNDYFTIRRWLSRRALSLAEEVVCRDALNLSLRMNKQIEEELIEAPYRIPLAIWSGVLMQKLIKDKALRGSSMRILGSLFSSRAGSLLLSKLTRETY